jgi:hypothetical protein
MVAASEMLAAVRAASAASRTARGRRALSSVAEVDGAVTRFGASTRGQVPDSLTCRATVTRVPDAFDDAASSSHAGVASAVVADTLSVPS